MPDVQKNHIVTCCSDADVTTAGSKKIDPLLKLFIGRKVMMNDNVNVKNKISVDSDPIVQFAMAFSALVHNVDHMGVRPLLVYTRNAVSVNRTPWI